MSISVCSWAIAPLVSVVKRAVICFFQEIDQAQPYAPGLEFGAGV
jgi:hypothetical protein